jgi:hypothetical protein
MKSAHYEACRHSVTVRTDDLAVLHMLRGLAQHCESGPYPQIAWGGTSETEWRRVGGRATLRFTATTDRARFLKEAGRLLVPGVWSLEGTSDDDPARPRRT